MRKTFHHIKRQRKRRKENLAHRYVVYDAVLDGVLCGKDSPVHLRERWNKLKEARGI